MLKLRPSDADAHFNLGVCLAGEWEHTRAVEHLKMAIAIRPTSMAAHLWLGKSLYVLGDIRTAVASYRKALRYEPASAEAHWALSLAHLIRGEYATGWKEYEWRWKWPQFPSPQRNFQQAQWKGEALNGRTILLHAEQGFGDTLQFARYVPFVSQAGGRVILEVPAALYKLMRNSFGVVECIPSGGDLPDFALHCPLMSLPLAFGTTLQTIPSPARLSATASREPFGDSYLPRVGLVWAGGRGHEWNSRRSLSLKQFSPLWGVSGSVQFVSLQTGPAAAQMTDAPIAVVDGVASVEDFADTAKVLAGLDLVITVDTAVAHLAGSMGKPVWILLAETPDWRWGLEGEMTPWYPTARLFRASRQGGWPELFERVATELGSGAKFRASAAAASKICTSANALSSCTL